MKIIRPVCCGIDVHKSFIVAVIATSKNSFLRLTKPHRFSTFGKGLRAFKEWLDMNNCKDVCMESTGKYWIPIYRIVADDQHIVKVVNPKYVKAPSGKKTDKKDATRIAELFVYDCIPHFSFIPPAEILELRDIVRYRRKIVNTMSSEKNRLSNCLTVSGIKLDEVLSDLHGSKTGKALIANIIVHGTDFDPQPFISPGVKASLEEFQLALDGEITPATHEKMIIISDHLRFLENKKADLERSMVELSSQHLPQLAHLISVPGVDTLSAIAILSEIGADMLQFGSPKRLLSWVGVVPQNNESAGKKKSTRIAKGNGWLKPVLIQCANAAIKDKAHPEIRQKYLSIMSRRGKMKAKVAIAKRLVTAIYFMLLRDEDYKPYKQVDRAPNRGKIELKTLVLRAQNSGYTIEIDGQPLDFLANAN